jgi:hypothetical protein
LFCLERNELPDWLYLWDDDFETVQAYVNNYMRAVVAQFHGQAHVWYATAGTNLQQSLSLSEEERLRLTISAIESLRHQDRQTPVLVGIAQPWGEYLSRASLDLSPWQFADVIVRAELNVSGFVLELDLNTTARHTLPRDLLEFHRMLDQWATFNLPLIIRLSAPTTIQADTAHLNYIRELIELCWQKQVVQGVLWGQLIDRAADEVGLVRPDGELKPILGTLRDIWKRFRSVRP